MKKHSLILLVIIASVCLGGCAKNPNTNQTTTPVPAVNANSSQAQNQNATAQKTDGSSSSQQEESILPPQALLQGTYAISEVQHDGMVEMISTANTTEITFKAPSAFYRVSKKEGKSDFKDNGQYKIEGKDKLILTILMSNDKMQLKPVSKQHTFWISPSGDELKLTSAKGNTAVFRRIRNN
jgi:outer membrane murein-binding lipoprotein Lpp